MIVVVWFNELLGDALDDEERHLRQRKTTISSNMKPKLNGTVVATTVMLGREAT